MSTRLEHVTALRCRNIVFVVCISFISPVCAYRWLQWHRHSNDSNINLNLLRFIKFQHENYIFHGTLSKSSMVHGHDATNRLRAQDPCVRSFRPKYAMPYDMYFRRNFISNSHIYLPNALLRDDVWFRWFERDAVRLAFSFLRRGAASLLLELTKIWFIFLLEKMLKGR